MITYTTTLNIIDQKISINRNYVFITTIIIQALELIAALDDVLPQAHGVPRKNCNWVVPRRTLLKHS